MDRFGLDFGTTNSACCYYDDEKKAFDFLKFDKKALDFFPTMIAYRKDDDRIRYIGEAAKRYQFSPKFDVYELFKMSLGQNAKEKGGRKKCPQEVAQDFLDEVIQKFMEKSGTLVNNIVMTVPDIWKNEENNKIAVDNLTAVYEHLGFEVNERVAFESEPVSAAAYYCREVRKGSYKGHLVVIDYGGGTLDLTLCRTEDGKNITVLRRCGNGGSSDMGCAGTAFDNGMTRRIIEKYNLDKERYQPGTKEFMALRNAFEEAKISSTEITKAALCDYYMAYDKVTGESYDDRVAFSVSGYGLEDDFDVMASDIAEVYKAVNYETMEQALNQMLKHCEALSVDTKSQTHFRVLMVGGFSNLYCVESQVRKTFESIDGVKDDRFDNGMKLDARSTAVAHGAAIIAAGMITIDYHCQSDIGFYYYDVFSESEKSVALIERDKPVKDYKEPRYFNGILKVSPLGKVSSIRLFFDDGNGKIPVRMDETLRELCPNINVPDNTYQIGFSMGKHQIPMLHIRDKSGAVRSESLHKIIEKISLQLR